MASDRSYSFESGEALFGAFVQPCIDSRRMESKTKLENGREEDFDEACYLRYTEFTRTGETPTRAMLKKDFPVPSAALAQFAASRGITLEDEVWSRPVVAAFWRTAHNKDNFECRVKRAQVLALLPQNDVVYVAIDGETHTHVVNLLHLPIRVGDIVSLHKLMICEIREE